MSTSANLTNDPKQVISGNDSIVIKKVLDTIRGGRTLDMTGYAYDTLEAGHVIIQETATGNLKPMPATKASSGNIATLGSVTAGSTYTNGTYENVPLSGGTGSGALATVVISGAVVSTVTVTKAGSGYTVGDVLSADKSYIGGTGSGFSVPVATVGTTDAAYGSLPAGHTYTGVLIASLLSNRPFASVLTIGTVNPSACPFPMSSILSAFKTAVPMIDWRAD